MKKPDQGFVVNQFELPIYVSKGQNFHVTPILTQINAPNANTYLGLVKNKPGTRIPEHDHGEVFEALYIISGGGKFIIEDVVYRGGPGSFVYFPAGVRHSYVNDLDDIMSAVQVYGPAGIWEKRYFDWKTWAQILPQVEGENVLK